MLKGHEWKIELGIVLLLFVAINVFGQAFQQPISANSGQGFDGVFYFKVAEQLADHRLPSTRSPYVYCIGTPLLASVFFKSELLLGFKVINVAGNLLIALLFVVWLRLYLNNWKTRVLVTALFLSTWLGPVRFVYYYPVYCDPWLFVALLAGLIGIKKAQSSPTGTSITWLLFLGLVAFVGVVFREGALIIPVAFLFSTNPVLLSREASSALANLQIGRVVKRVQLASFLPLVFGVLGVLTVLLVASPDNSYSFIRQAFKFAYSKPFLTYLHAWFIAFGPIIVILIYCWRGVSDFLVKNQFMLVYLVGFAVLAWIGGSDTERILFWSAPVIYLLVGKSIEDNAALTKAVLTESRLLVIALFVAQLLSERVFWTIPDYPNRFVTSFPILTPLSNNFQYLDLYSWHGNRVIEAISFLEYLLLSVVLLWWLSHRAQRLRPTEAQ